MSSPQIIQDPSKKSGQTAVGVKGIANSTSLGPEQRTRVLKGIIQADSREKGRGAVSKSEGRTATKREIGMVHLPGTY